ncbi:chromate efflux transporter [Paenibacillus provencensis]|uniref:Chromate efflux transporter n=1 Tax=Paenibacillus provencensis TaxID=441151 RepID=A0ABW3QE60_9BACL|nr:chromate efflux transporter [Paenibacillus sp. MER 78]MCM3129436.1 chromate efflux transporter [Paenibacillus sp. MER 78]
MGTRLWEVFTTALKLGLTSFGGPVAHLGYFHNEYVMRRKWIDERTYADLVALSHFLPGPASSQVGMGVGMMRAGVLGGIIAWLGFTLPSVLALFIAASLLQQSGIVEIGWMHGLKIVAVAIVAHAVWSMGKNLAPDRSRMTIAALACVLVVIWPSAITQVSLIIAAGLAGVYLYRGKQESAPSAEKAPIQKGLGIFCLVLFFLLLFCLPLLSEISGSAWIAYFDSFYRAGALVFGGGHVVLPMLERELVPQGLIDADAFLAGYGLTQAVPGPLFTFASYLGTIMEGALGAVIFTVAIFLPGALLIIGAIPFWQQLRGRSGIQGALKGVNAAVVGLLLAAFYDPVFTSAVRGPYDFALALVLFVMLVWWKLPPWIIVLIGLFGGMALNP